MFKNIRIIHRIALAALLPLATLAALAIYEISVKWTIRSEMAAMQPAVEGVGKLSRFVHELQRERGLSLTFLASRGAQMRGELVDQRRRTDAERGAALDVLADLGRDVRGPLASASQAARDGLGRFDNPRGDRSSGRRARGGGRLPHGRGRAPHRSDYRHFETGDRG